MRCLADRRRLCAGTRCFRCKLAFSPSSPIVPIVRRCSSLRRQPGVRALLLINAIVRITLVFLAAPLLFARPLTCSFPTILLPCSFGRHRPMTMATLESPRFHRALHAQRKLQQHKTQITELENPNDNADTAIQIFIYILSFLRFSLISRLSRR
jgi:hypothetical protein